MQSTQSPIDPSLARSWLLVNAMRVADFGPDSAGSADQVILDLEDAVDPSAKGQARQLVADWLADAGNSGWVRINDCRTPYWADDIDHLAQSPNLRGFVLAKADEASHVIETFERAEGRVPVVALVESALGVENAVEIARSPGCFRLAFGAGDYRRDTGASANPLAMAYPRSRLVVASRVGGLPGPIDGPTVGDRDLIADSEMAVALGLTGRLCLEAAHTSTVNQVISPSAADIRWARGFLADFDESDGIIRDGSVLPRLGRARTIDTLAEAFGIDA